MLQVVPDANTAGQGIPSIGFDEGPTADARRPLTPSLRRQGFGMQSGM